MAQSQPAALWLPGQELVVVTRHQPLVQYLRELGYIGPDTPILSHATASDVRDRHVLGKLPLSVACAAASVSEIPLHLEPQDRGHEISLARLREVAQEPRTYKVLRIY